MQSGAQAPPSDLSAPVDASSCFMQVETAWLPASQLANPQAPLGISSLRPRGRPLLMAALAAAPAPPPPDSLLSQIP